jgi:MFS family permease
MPRRRSNAYYLKAASFFSGLAFYTPIVPLYFLSHGVNVGAVVLAQAFYAIGTLLFEVPTGVLADRFGHRKSVIASTPMVALGMMTTVLCPNIVGLFGANALFGLGEALQSGSAEALLFEGTKAEGKRQDYKRHLSHVLSYANIAFAVGTAGAGIAYGRWHNHAFVPLIILAAGCQIAALLINLRLRDVPSDEANPFAGSNMWQLFRQSFDRISHDSVLRNITYTRLLTLPATYVLYGSFQPYFQSRGVSPYFIGLVLTIGSFMNGLALHVVHRAEKYLSLDKAILVFNLILGLVYLGFSTVRSPLLLVLVYILLQALYNLQEPFISDYINDRTSSGIRASVLSGVSLIRQLGNAVNKITLGLLLTPFGFQGMLRVQAAYLVLGSFLSYWLMVRCGCVYRIDPAAHETKIELATDLEAEVQN